MAEEQILTEDDPVELLEGWLVVNVRATPPHEATTHMTHRALHRRLPAGLHMRVKSALTTQDSEPEPDLDVVRGEPLDYRSHFPYPEDIPLVIEASDSSLARDRDIKARIYARAGIPKYWIVNLIDKVIEIYTDPIASEPMPHYQKRQDYRAGDSIPLTLADHALDPIDACELLP